MGECTQQVINSTLREMITKYRFRSNPCCMDRCKLYPEEKQPTFQFSEALECVSKELNETGYGCGFMLTMQFVNMIYSKVNTVQFARIDGPSQSIEDDEYEISYPIKRFVIIVDDSVIVDVETIFRQLNTKFESLDSTDNIEPFVETLLNTYAGIRFSYYPISNFEKTLFKVPNWEMQDSWYTILLSSDSVPIYVNAFDSKWIYV